MKTASEQQDPNADLLRERDKVTVPGAIAHGMTPEGKLISDLNRAKSRVEEFKEERIRFGRDVALVVLAEAKKRNQVGGGTLTRKEILDIIHETFGTTIPEQQYDSYLRGGRGRSAKIIDGTPSDLREQVFQEARGLNYVP